ncbi:MAG TPA: RES family NAD+ phosphorylase [Chthoniobacterales bacterium]
MNVRPNVRYAQFVSRLRGISPAPGPWEGVAFRSVALEYGKPEQITSGEGSLKFGGRWNAPGTFSVVYASTRPGTAIEEAFHLAAEYEFTPDHLKPRLTCGIEWRLERVFDLTNKNLPVWLKLEKWMQENFSRINHDGSETLCQALGRAARNLGMSAILYPSARVSGGVNLAVFRHRLRKEESMRLLGEEELKRYLA